MFQANRFRRKNASNTIRITVAAALLIGVVGPALAGETGRFSAIEENDFFTPDNRDRHYTQGAQIGYLSPDLGAGGMATPMDWLNSLLPVFPKGPTTSRHFDLFIGQEIFTPQDKTLAVPDPHDRPYAGWLNAGIGFLDDADQRTLDHFALQIGIVGPASYAKQTQNRFHLAIDNPDSKGWDYQLHDEPTLNFYAERHRRFIADLDDALSVEAIPEAGAAVGNAYDYLAAGGVARFGKNLRVDYGPALIGPGPSGTDYFNAANFKPDSRWGWYVFIGAEGRAVAHNIFLDGNSFQASRSVPRRPLVGDLVTGAALFYSSWARVSYTYVNRSDEFYGQHNADNFGSIMASIVLPF
ncbi:MAG TPA: lipid A deacylase LpxR family protein [Alphaproteobacteria bacterium]|nr:lipid A deacylase LpxR family protein [Alphaproteobacteria bacterium]